MSFTLRRVAGTAVLALAASALTLPLAPAASAVVPVERVWTLADSDLDGTYGLFAQDVPGGTPTAVDETASASFSDLSTSADGSRLIYVRETDAASQVVVRDISGRVVRSLVSFPTSGNTFVMQPYLTPNGATAVWTEVTFGTSTFTVNVRKAVVGTGAVSTVVTGYGLLGVLDATTLLVQNATSGAIKTIALTGGAVAATSGLPTAADQVTVSQAGTHIAWSVDTSPSSGNSTAEIHVGTLANNAGTWTVTGDTTLSGTLDNEQPAFSRDGATVYWVQFDGDVGPGEVLTRPFDASTAATTLVATASDEFDVAVTELPSADTTAPGTATATPAVLYGTTAWLNWTLPADADLSGVQVTCKHGATVQRNVFVPAPLVTYADAGLVLNYTYTCTFTTVDRSGNVGPVATRNFVALKAGAAFADPTSTTSAKAPFPVSFAASAPNNTTFDVDYVPTSSTTWRHWVVSATGRVRTFGVAATLPVYSTTSTPGTNYVFRVRAHDPYGNFTPFVVSAHAVVPFDQTKATLVGGSNVSTAAAYLGSYRRLWKTTDYAKITVVGNRLQVVGIKCSSCGSFDVYDGNTKIATISSYTAGTSIYRAVLFTRTYSGTHTFTIKPKATAGHPYVMLDGFGMRR